MGGDGENEGEERHGEGSESLNCSRSLPLSRYPCLLSSRLTWLLFYPSRSNVEEQKRGEKRQREGFRESERERERARDKGHEREQEMERETETEREKWIGIVGNHFTLSLPSSYPLALTRLPTPPLSRFLSSFSIPFTSFLWISEDNVLSLSTLCESDREREKLFTGDLEQRMDERERDRKEGMVVGVKKRKREREAERKGTRYLCLPPLRVWIQWELSASRKEWPMNEGFLKQREALKGRERGRERELERERERERVVSPLSFERSRSLLRNIYLPMEFQGKARSMLSSAATAVVEWVARERKREGERRKRNEGERERRGTDKRTEKGKSEGVRKKMLVTREKEKEKGKETGITNDGEMIEGGQRRNGVLEGENREERSPENVCECGREGERLKEWRYSRLPLLEAIVHLAVSEQRFATRKRYQMKVHRSLSSITSTSPSSLSLRDDTTWLLTWLER